MCSASPVLLDPKAAKTAQAIQADSCRRLTRRVLVIKESLIARYRREGVPMSLVREAIAAAEAKAWLSGFPHLFLPDLADEILRQKQTRHEYAQAA